MHSLRESVLGLAVFCAACFAGEAGFSQYATPSVQAVQSSPTDILQALLPKATDGSRGVNRTQPTSEMSAEAPKATLLIAFEENTGRLTVEGMRTIAALAQAMQDPRLQGAKFQIAAHGFAAADPQLQTRTSRRAQIVAEHLAGFYNIDIYNLSSIGLGAQYLVNPGDSNDPLNNRIEVFNLSAN